MTRIWRDWMEQIPDYARVRTPRRGKPVGEETTGMEGEADPSPSPGEDTGDRAREGEPGDEFALHIPDEVEAGHREDEEKRRRSTINLNLAPQSFSLQGHYLRNMAARFARMISKVAEDSADMPTQGDEEWDLNELLKRRFTGRLISQCRMTREKRKVAIVLDTSPSCSGQARLFAAIARIAEDLGDCELYDAPNFVITAHKSGEEWEQLGEAEKEWRFRGRVVLAFGDFDGIGRICEASALRRNKIYWFCCEERPEVLELNREQFVKDFKGRYFPANNPQQLMKAIARVR